MMKCWESEPEARPSFSDLTQQLKRLENQHKVRLNSTLFNKECFLFPEFVEGTGYETRQTSKRNLFVRVLT